MNYWMIILHALSIRLLFRDYQTFFYIFPHAAWCLTLSRCMPLKFTLDNQIAHM